MDNVKIGQFIYKLRKENNLTQLQLAQKIGVSDKAVSKWERGLGCPDVSLLPELAGIFGVDLETFLSGEPDENQTSGGNMKKIKFYVCPSCGNLITTSADAGISCCGKKLSPILPQKASDSEKLNVEIIENEFYITAHHPMEREHYISFAALVTGDTLLLRKLYPEWDVQVRLPILSRCRLFWYCTQHGLFYQEVSPRANKHGNDGEKEI